MSLRHFPVQIAPCSLNRNHSDASETKSSRATHRRLQLRERVLNFFCALNSVLTIRRTQVPSCGPEVAVKPSFLDCQHPCRYSPWVFTPVVPSSCLVCGKVAQTMGGDRWTLSDGYSCI